MDSLAADVVCRRSGVELFFSCSLFAHAHSSGFASVGADPTTWKVVAPCPATLLEGRASGNAACRVLTEVFHLGSYRTTVLVTSLRPSLAGAAAIVYPALSRSALASVARPSTSLPLSTCTLMSDGAVGTVGPFFSLTKGWSFSMD